MEELADKGAVEAVPKRNRGWFQRGDGRINREGRPKGSKAGSPGVGPADRAPCADRLMLVRVPRGNLKNTLSRPPTEYIENLPHDFEIVDCRLVNRDIIITIRSSGFSRVEEGAPIPEFAPLYKEVPPFPVQCPWCRHRLEPARVYVPVDPPTPFGR
jgi:hypothetical protein